MIFLIFLLQTKNIQHNIASNLSSFNVTDKSIADMIHEPFKVRSPLKLALYRCCNTLVTRRPMVFILVSSRSDEEVSTNFRAIMGPFLIGFSSGQQLSQEIWGLWLFISLLTWFYITKEKSCRLFRTNSGSLRRRVQGWDNITSQLYQTGQFKAEFVENDLRCSPCSSF